MSDEETNNIVEQPAVENPLLTKLKRRMPGERFRLPSRGLFYTNGELDSEVEDGEVTVFPMNTVDELKMRSEDMLFQGSAITEVIARCVPQVKRPEKLIASDVDFILTCLRKVSFGPLLPIKHKCRHCDIPEKEFNLSIDHFIQSTKEITKDQFNKMTVTIDEIYTVKLRPCTFDEFIKILQRTNDSFDSAEKVAAWINQSLLAVIRSVDKITDRDQILQWLEELPPNIKLEIQDHIEILNKWGLEFSYEIVCEGCKKTEDIKTSLNPVGFFTLPSSRKTK